MSRRTFLVLCPVDCADPVEVTVERRPPGCDYRAEEWFHLASFPSQCKCGALIHRAEPSQEELRAAYHLPEAEDV